jgi:hypothetical protein
MAPCTEWVRSCCAEVALGAARADVRFWHKADIQQPPGDVRFWGDSGHGNERPECLLLTQSGHRAPDKVQDMAQRIATVLSA